MYLTGLIIYKRRLSKKENWGYWLLGNVYWKKESWGGVRVIEILNYNFLRLKAFIENKKTWRWAFIVGAFIKNTNFVIFCLF